MVRQNRILDLLDGERGLDEGGFGAGGRLGAAEDADPLADGIDEDGRHQDEEEGADEGVEVVVEDQRLGGFGLFGGLFERLGGGEEADAGEGGEDLHQRRGEGDRSEPEHGEDGDPHVLFAVHFDEHCRAEAEGDDGEKLVGDAEEGPEGVDAAQGVRDALVEEEAPADDDGGGGAEDAGPPAGAAEGGVEVAEEILQHEAADAGAGVDHREDEQGFEHDGEVVPEREEAFAAAAFGEDVGHAECQRWRAAGAVEERFFANGFGEVGHLFGGDGEAPGGDGFDGRVGGGADDAGGGVDGEVDTGVEDAGGDDGHDGDEAFEQHAAVGDGEGVGFLGDHLGGGAGGDEGVEAADGAAGDGDEAEGEDIAGEDGAGAVDEPGERGHLELGLDEEDADAEEDDDAEFDEGAEVVAGGEEEPDGEGGGGEAVDDDAEGERGAGEGEPGGEVRRVGDPFAAEDGGEDEEEADDGDFEDFAGAEVAEVEAHEDRYRHGGGDGEGAPGGAFEGVDDDEGDDGEEDDHDEQDGDEGGEAADFTYLLAAHLAEGFAVATHGAEEDDEVLDAAAEDGADDDPECTGEVAELGGEGGADEGAGAGDGGEVVAEDDPFIGGFVVVAVAEAFGGGGAVVIEGHDGGGDPAGVDAVGEYVDADGGDDQPHGVDGFAAVDGDAGEGEGAGDAESS